MTSAQFYLRCVPWIIAAYVFPSARCCDSTPVNIIEVMLGDNSVYGHAIQGPPLDVAFRRAQMRYPLVLANATRTRLYVPGAISCEDAGAMMSLIAAKADAATRGHIGAFTVLILTGCTMEALVLGDFAREWNFPMLVTIGSGPKLRDGRRYPNVLSFSGADGLSYLSGVVTFLEHYQWSTIAILCDILSELPSNAVYTSAVARDLLALLNRNKTYDTYWYEFDSRDDHSADGDYRRMFLAAGTKSRVFFIASDPARVRDIMVVAHKLNLTTGDYVYLAPASTRFPGQGDMTWQQFDEDDELALAAYQSLIFIHNPYSNWTNIEDLLREIADHSALAYNYTINNDSYRNDLAIAGYETMTCLAIILNETGCGLRTIGGQEFRDRFLGRIFPLASRTVKIRQTGRFALFDWPQRTFNLSGFRVSDVLFSRVNSESRQMEVAWIYLAIENRLNQASPIAQSWPSGHGPPMNRPQCGFQNELCHEIGLLSPLSIALYVLLGIGLIFVIFLIRWKIRRDADQFREIWEVFALDEKALRRSKRLEKKRNSLECNTTEMT